MPLAHNPSGNDALRPTLPGDVAFRHAARLLELLSIAAPIPIATVDHPALAWRRAGLMAVTGMADGPGLVCPVPLASLADGAMLALRAIASDPALLPASGAQLLGERARLMGLSRQGRVSANGSCRLIDTADGRIALNLARDDDRDLLPILFDVERLDGWEDVVAAAARCAADDVVNRGIELGMPLANDRLVSAPLSPFDIAGGPSAPAKVTRRPLVLDFSALWAGPLAASLLAMLGADVIKVESISRLDGARRGHGGFYDLLNAGKRSVAIDFANADELHRLMALVERADMVIEASRPRALRRLSIDREQFASRGGIWVSITGHDDPDRVGFGDDAAVGGGLAAQMANVWGAPMFAGDAIADPLTGIHAALAAWALWQSGRPGLVQLSLARTIAFACGVAVADKRTVRQWQALAECDEVPFYRLRTPCAVACAAGAHNRELL